MVGASARYSCLHIPVETGTSPFSIRIEAGGGRLCRFPTADIVLIVVRLFAESARCVFAVSRPVTLYWSECSNQLISAVVIFRSLTGEAAVLGCGRSRTLHYHYLLRLYGFGIVNAEGIYSYLLHCLSVDGLIVAAGHAICDLVDILHALDDLAEGGILAVKVRCVLVHDEKLAAGGVGCHGTGHGQNASGVLEVVLHTVHSELTLDAVARAADADTLRVAALDHEASDDAVEDNAVIEVVLYE